MHCFYQQSEASAILYCDPTVSGGWCTDHFAVRGWERNDLNPAMLPSPSPTPDPTPMPSNPPSSNPTKAPIQIPTNQPSSQPSNMPTESPTYCIDANACDITPRNILDEITTDPICDEVLLDIAMVKFEIFVFFVVFFLFASVCGSVRWFVSSFFDIILLS